MFRGVSFNQSRPNSRVSSPREEIIDLLSPRLLDYLVHPRIKQNKINRPSLSETSSHERIDQIVPPVRSPWRM